MRRHLLFGLGCFTVTLFPVLGFIDMYFLALSRVSDHFEYLPLIFVVALVAAPIGLYVYGGATGHASDAVTAVLEIAGQGLASAVVASNLVLNVADKMMAGYVGLAIVRALPEDLLAGVRLPGTGRFGTLAMVLAGEAIGVALAAVYLLFLAPPVG